MFSARRIILLIIIISGLVMGAHAAKLYGSVYEWSDLEKPLKNVIVEIEENGTRVQYKVSGDGTYSFDVAPGKYILKAKYFIDNILEFSGEEKLQIDKPDESRNLDLLIFPPTDLDYEYLADINLTGELDPGKSNITNYIILIIFVLLISIILLFLIRRTKNKTAISEEDEIPEEAPLNNIPPMKKKTDDLPEDLRELYDTILKKGGRTTQKEIRKDAKYGEAKVSLMLADLEDRGLVKKIRKGRSNIIIAEDLK
ncbi:MAG: hypothetical protein OIN87_03470 [Candidatus Methanoperedens sp.]|nr:hypothetical protein [Candidatus Methanoperedens sp.]